MWVDGVCASGRYQLPPMRARANLAWTPASENCRGQSPAKAEAVGLALIPAIRDPISAVAAINGSWSGSLLGSLPGAVSCTAPATSPPTWRNNSKVSVLAAPEALIMSRSATGSSGSRPRR